MKLEEIIAKFKNVFRREQKPNIGDNQFDLGRRVFLAAGLAAVAGTVLWYYGSRWPYSNKLIQIKDTDKIDIYRRVYWNTLVHYIPHSGFSPPIGGKLDILDLGCGIAHYAVPLKAYFEGNDHYLDDEGEKVRYYGVDIQDSMIEKARKLHANKTGYKFFCDDARNIEEIAELPDKVDIVVIRHPQPGNNPEMGASPLELWKEIFEAAARKIKSNGIFLISFYSKGERDIFMDKVIKKIPDYDITYNEQNIIFRDINPTFCQDNYFMVARLK